MCVSLCIWEGFSEFCLQELLIAPLVGSSGMGSHWGHVTTMDCHVTTMVLSCDIAVGLETVGIFRRAAGKSRVGVLRGLMETNPSKWSRAARN